MRNTIQAYHEGKRFKVCALLARESNCQILLN